MVFAVRWKIRSGTDPWGMWHLPDPDRRGSAEGREFMNVVNEYLKDARSLCGGYIPGCWIARQSATGGLFVERSERGKKMAEIADVDLGSVCRKCRYKAHPIEEYQREMDLPGYD